MSANIQSPNSEEEMLTTSRRKPIRDTTDTSNKKESTGHSKQNSHSDILKNKVTKKKKQGSKKAHNNSKKNRNNMNTNRHLDNKKPQNSSTTTLLPSSPISKPTWIPSPTPTYGNGATAAFDNSSSSQSSSILAATAGEAEYTGSTPSYLSDEEYNTDTKSNDSLMGSMLGVLGGITVLLITIIIFASHRRRKGRRNDAAKGLPREKRGWGVRHSWYSTSGSSVTSQCPSTLPPPYDEKKRELVLEPPSPTITKSTQYAPQLAFSPSFSVDSSHLIQETITNQQDPMPAPPPSTPPAAPFATTTTSNNSNSNHNNSPTAGNFKSTRTTTTPYTSILSPPNIQFQCRHQQHERLPAPSAPTPRSSRSLVRTYQAQLDNNKIGSSPNDPNYP